LKRLISLIPITLLLFSGVCYAAIGEMWSVGSNTAGDNAATVDSSGNMNVKNNLAVTGTSVFTGATTMTGGITNNGFDIKGAQSVSKVTASSDTTITPTKSVIAITVTAPDAGVVSTAHPFLATTTATNYSYYRVVLLSTNSFVIQDNDTDAGSLVELSTATQYTLTKGPGILLYYYDGKYYQDGTGIATAGDYITITGTMQAATLKATTLLDVNEDVDIDFDASDEEFNLTTSSGGVLPAMVVYNSTTDLPGAIDQTLLGLDFKDDGDAQGTYLRCRDNTFANTVFKISADGATTIDASGAGSGTVLSESTLVANDAAFRIDSETQDLQLGDGTNNTVISDNGCITQTGSATTILTKVGYANANGNTVYNVEIATSIKKGGTYTLSLADAKVGKFEVMGGTFTAKGTFIADGTPTLITTGSSTDVYTAAGTQGISFTDGGTSVVFTNNSATVTYWIKYTWIN